MVTPAAAVIATVVVSSSQGRADAVACCAALALRQRLAVESPLVLMVGARPGRPALLSSPTARNLEAEVAALEIDGVTPAARGHLCIVSCPPAGEEGNQAAVEALTRLAGAHTPIVVSLAPTELEAWQRQITLIRADLPVERELLTLLADATGQGDGVLRVDKRGPGRIGARRALAGLLPGRVSHARYVRLLRGL